MRVDDCPAGPGMDAAVARVLGQVACDQWRLMRASPPTYYMEVDMETKDRPCGHSNCYPVDSGPPPHSVRIGRAWELVEKMKLHVGPIVDDLGRTSGWYCADDHDLNEAAVFHGGGTAPLAICRAFLKANGVEEI